MSKTGAVTQMSIYRFVAILFSKGPAAKEHMMMSSGRFSADMIGTNPFQGGAGE